MSKDKKTDQSTSIQAQEGRESNTLLHEDKTFSLGFTQMPNQVLYARNLSPQAKTLYAILLSYSWKADKCFPGYTKLCEHMSLSEKIVRKHMKELEAAKLLSQKRRGLGMTNIYTLLSLKNARLDLGSEAERDTSPVLERDTGNLQQRDTGNDKEYTFEEDTELRINSNIRNARARDTQEEKDEVTEKPRSHVEPTTTGNRTKKTPQREPQTELTPLVDAILSRFQQLQAQSTQQTKRKENGYTEEEDAIALYLEAHSRSLGDAKHTKSNVRQAINLFTAIHEHVPELNLDHFLYLLDTAKEVTDNRRGIKKRNPDGTINKMSYYFEVLKDLLLMRAGQKYSKQPKLLN